jgi:hypothetical protein
MLLFSAYVLQQRFVPFLSLRVFHAAVNDIAVDLKRSKSVMARPDAGRAALRELSPVRAASFAGPSASGAPVRRRSWFEPDLQEVAKLRRSSVFDRLRLHNAVVFVGLAMQRVMADYNNLESTYLITALLILLSGMVFKSRGFPDGSLGYHVLTALVASIILFATVSFVVLLAVELYKSFRDSELHLALRTAEAASVEASLRQGVRSRGAALATPAASRGVESHDGVPAPAPPYQPTQALDVRSLRAAAMAKHGATTSRAEMGAYFAKPQRIRGGRRAGGSDATSPQ